MKEPEFAAEVSAAGGIGKAGVLVFRFQHNGSIQGEALRHGGGGGESV